VKVLRADSIGRTGFQPVPSGVLFLERPGWSFYHFPSGKECKMLKILLWLVAIKVTISVPWNLVCLLGEIGGERKGE
jgi:hypothetical protein